MQEKNKIKKATLSKNPVTDTSKLKTELRQVKEKLSEKDKQISELLKAKNAQDEFINQILSSTSWKITAPIRKAKNIYVLASKLLNPRMSIHYYNSFKQILKNEGVAGVISLIKKKIEHPASLEDEYHKWIRAYDTLDKEDVAAIKKHIKSFKYNPLISVIMPVYNIDEEWLRQAIESVLNQHYENFELCIADDHSPRPHVREVIKEYASKDSRIKYTFREVNGHISECSNSALALADGEYIALFDHDDLLTEHALYYVVEALNRDKSIDLLYSDEDKVDMANNRFMPYFKPDFNIDLLYSNNYFCHFGVYRKSIIDKIGGFRKGYEGSQDHDLVLRAVKETTFDKIYHIPHIIYHWRAIAGSTARSLDSKDYTINASINALEDSLKNYGVKVTTGKCHGHFRVIWPVPEKEPLVDIIIPTKNRVELLEQCVSSLKSKTAYKNYKITIVDNQSDESKTIAYLSTLQESGEARVIKYDKPFNFSAINNLAVKNSDAEILCFLNNDIEIINSDWLREMVSHALRKDVGIVGAKLYYPNMRVQHGGVILGCGAPMTAVAGHLFHGISQHNNGYFGRASCVQELSAVTAACMVMRREVFNQVKGFDDKHLAVAFNDVDLCLKVKDAGYRIVWTPYAELIHHESASRGSDLEESKYERFFGEVKAMRNKYGKRLDDDKQYNPNLNVLRADFSFAFPPRVENPWTKYKKANDDDV